MRMRRLRIEPRRRGVPRILANLCRFCAEGGATHWTELGWSNLVPGSYAARRSEAVTSASPFAARTPGASAGTIRTRARRACWYRFGN